jgi:hypothetical protein
MGEIRECTVGVKKYAQQQKEIGGFATMKAYRENERRKCRNSMNAFFRRSSERNKKKLESRRRYRRKLKSKSKK